MRQETSDSTGLKKLKVSFILGLTSNLTTFAGCSAVWIILSRNGWISGLWQIVLTVFSFAPIFMADAINNYTLARIRLEHQNNWDDIQVSLRGREITDRYFLLFRIASIIPTYILAAIAIATYSGNTELIESLKLVFLTTFIINMCRSLWFQASYMATEQPKFGGKYLIAKAFIFSGVFVLWFSYLWNESQFPYSNGLMFCSGIVYLVLSAMMHPLPTKYSICRSSHIRINKTFFNIGLLNKKDFNKVVPNANDIENIEESFKKEGFIFISYIRMPLIELPLFQSWGIAMHSSDRKTLALAVFCEVKKEASRYLISELNNNFVIDTDFEAPNTKLPQNIQYHQLAKNIDNSTLIKQHQKHIPKSSSDMTQQSWKKLESLVQYIVKFLESEKISENKQIDTDKLATVIPEGN